MQRAVLAYTRAHLAWNLELNSVAPIGSCWLLALQLEPGLVDSVDGRDRGSAQADCRARGMRIAL